MKTISRRLIKKINGMLLIGAVILIFVSITGCSGNDFNGVSASGTVSAAEVNMTAEIGGRIIDVTVKEGVYVKKGEVLGHLESKIQALQVNSAEAVLCAAIEKAKETKAGNRAQLIAQAQMTIEQVDSLQQGARQAMENSRGTLERMKELFIEGGVTQQQVSDAETAYATAKAQYESYGSQKKSAEQHLDLLKSGATREVLNIADAGVTQAQANLEIAKTNLEKTILYAPVDGIISSVNFNEGEVVLAGSRVLTIMETKDMWIDVYVSETELPKIKLGQQAEINIDAFPEKVFHGEVNFISPEAEFTPKNLQTKDERVNMVFGVRVAVIDGKDILKTGLPADVKILTH
ncbi:HlyD family secretion protein [Phosphitispora sp. TUW77]|uniref:HlyD family secretion protein n=1 Tax=Phosphitispora sp. TUW77 TaxID=3152361 RepID=UPI003AB33410